MESRLDVYSDGASRGNPGPSAVAFIILAPDGRILKETSNRIGVRTNNQAEYEALISALRHASRLTDREIVCYMDSELVVKQLNEEYQVRDEHLMKLWLEVQQLKQLCEKVSFIWLPRTNSTIQKADRLANEMLDEARQHEDEPRHVKQKSQAR